MFYRVKNLVGRLARNLTRKCTLIIKNTSSHDYSILVTGFLTGHMLIGHSQLLHRLIGMLIFILATYYIIHQRKHRIEIVEDIAAYVIGIAAGTLL